MTQAHLDGEAGAPVQRTGWLAQAPISMFAVVMTLAGTALASHEAGRLFLSWLPLGDGLSILSAMAFFAAVAVLSAKMWRHPIALSRELHDPARTDFFAAISVSLLLLAAAFYDTMPDLGRYFWITGALLQFVFTIHGLSKWVDRSAVRIRAHPFLSPAWFIPVTGNLLVPVAGIHFAPADINWFFFSIGMMFWLVLLAVSINRLIFHSTPKENLPALLAMLVAPPAAAFISYFRLEGEIDVFARLLYFNALFLTFFVVVKARHWRGGAESMASWAYLLPLALVAVATMVLHMAQGQPIYLYLGIVLQAALLALVAGFAVKLLMLKRA